MNIMSYQRVHILRLEIELLVILHLPRIVCCDGMVELGRKESPAECHGASRRLANHIFTLFDLGHLQGALIALIQALYITRVVGPNSCQIYLDSWMQSWNMTWSR